MLQARVTFSRSQIRCYVTIYAICCETTSNKTRVSPKHKARVNANMRLVVVVVIIIIIIVIIIIIIVIIMGLLSCVRDAFPESHVNTDLCCPCYQGFT